MTIAENSVFENFLGENTSPVTKNLATTLPTGHSLKEGVIPSVVRPCSYRYLKKADYLKYTVTFSRSDIYSYLKVKVLNNIDIRKNRVFEDLRFRDTQGV